MLARELAQLIRLGQQVGRNVAKTQRRGISIDRRSANEQFLRERGDIIESSKRGGSENIKWDGAGKELDRPRFR